VEVLVTIGVIGLLASLAIPAVLHSRESSRRQHCVSNLRQIMLAVHEFEAAQQRYPSQKFHGELLPHLGEHAEATKSVVYVCPSDPESKGEWSNEWQSYQMNQGLSATRKNLAGFAPAYRQAEVHPHELRDGQSQTAAIAERLAWPSIAGNVVYWEDYPQWWIRRLRDTAVIHTDLQAFADECEYRALKPLNVWVSISGYTHVLPPNRNSCINGTLMSSHDRMRAVTATSLHPGGINLAMADGSVRFVADEIDRLLWQGLGTRQGREVTGDF
jgi:prepilin-type processing-associated H-X9-DG protein